MTKQKRRHSMKYPTIAVTSDYKQGGYFTRREYSAAILAAGGLPVTLPYTNDPDFILGFLNLVDGLLLTGGSDINPMLFGEEPISSLGEVIPERDDFEMSLTQIALKQNLPILAICRGNLMLNIAAGGTVHQDIYAENGATVQHKQMAPRDHASHSIKIKEKTRLHQIFCSDTLRVNSFHHQAVKKPAPGFLVSAEAPDGVIEAIESPDHTFVLGVQWHPGSLLSKDPLALAIFREFVRASDGGI
jgi:putative glutamine amidotransferase